MSDYRNVPASQKITPACPLCRRMAPHHEPTCLNALARDESVTLREEVNKVRALAAYCREPDSAVRSARIREALERQLPE